MINEEERIEIYAKFVSFGTKNEQDAYIQSQISVCAVARRRQRKPQEESSQPPKGTMYVYEITTCSGKYRVCKKAFIRIHGITAQRVRRLCSLLSQGKAPIDQRGKNIPGNAKPGHIIQAIKRHIESFPIKTTHYSSAQYHYLDEKLNVKIMHSMFRVKHPETNVSYKFYYSIFKREYDLNFGRPQVDTCSTCEELDVKIKSKFLNGTAKRVSVAEKMVHVKRAKQFYNKMKEISEKVKNDETGKIGAVSIDYMQNLSLPCIPIQDTFYLRQLTVNVFCIHNHKDNTSCIYVYHEGTGGKGPNEVCSMLMQYFNEHMAYVDHLHIFSDGCGGQNKNHTMVRMCSALVSEGEFNVIDQYYPFRGHSFLACDRDFAVLKRKIKTADRVFTLKQYVELMVHSSNKANFVVCLPDNDTFIDLKKWWPKIFKRNMLSVETRGRNINKDNKVNFKISTFKHFKHSREHPGTVVASEHIGAFVTHTFELRAVNRGPIALPKALEYPVQKRAINKKKMDDIKKFKRFLPDQTHVKKFYNDIFQWKVCDHDVNSDED